VDIAASLVRDAEQLGGGAPDETGLKSNSKPAAARA